MAISLPIKVSVVGATGYTGQEVVRLLAAHPSFEIESVAGSDSSAGNSLSHAAPAIAGLVESSLQTAEQVAASENDAVFLALPHEASAELASRLLDAGKIVFDLSAAFRLDASAYPGWYGFDHPTPELTSEAVYGLCEFNRAAISDARLIAVPGCYPTATLLAARPLVEAGMIDAEIPVIVDAMSGVSGAGRRASAATSFCEVSAKAYGVLAHRHTPEMARHGGFEPRFVAHIGPWSRGILATIHATLIQGATVRDARRVLAERYASEAFVRLLPEHAMPQIADVAHTNLCDLGVGGLGNHLVLGSAIDNLTKGAAGQAVQCANIRFGLPETTGLGPAKATGSAVCAGGAV